MTNRDRDAAAREFAAIADELAGAENVARQKAADHLVSMPDIGQESIVVFVDAFVTGWIRDATERSAERIRRATTHFLTPRARPRGRR